MLMAQVEVIVDAVAEGQEKRNRMHKRLAGAGRNVFSVVPLSEALSLNLRGRALREALVEVYNASHTLCIRVAAKVRWRSHLWRNQGRQTTLRDERHNDWFSANVT